MKDDIPKFKVVSDGVKHRVFFGEIDVSSRVSSVEIDLLEARSPASATFHLVDVDLDVSAACRNKTMEVSVDGKIENRIVVGSDVMLDCEGNEKSLMLRPMLFEGEYACYYMDGQPPAILRHLSE